MGDISTRRAIEVCMSRLPMHDEVRRTMAMHLRDVIRYEPGQRAGDVDALRAALVTVADTASNIRDDLPRSALMQRLKSVVNIAGEALSHPPHAPCYDAATGE